MASSNAPASSAVVVIPASLRGACRSTEHVDWLRRLPETVGELQTRWRLSLGDPFDSTNVSWVAPALTRNGARAVLKIGLPHFEAMDEVAGLRWWNGNPTVCVLEADADANAMLLERCEPGASLRSRPEREQDIVLASLFSRLWRAPEPSHRFRPLAMMLATWTRETIDDAQKWPDPGLVREGLRLFDALSRPSSDDVLLATDLHAGNVLSARREPWLVIDPKPFVGDRAYDATQHLLNCKERMRRDPRGTICRYADLLRVDTERVRLWTFARIGAEPREDWRQSSIDLARTLA
jgi:streptomycin 6-kinase